MEENREVFSGLLMEVAKTLQRKYTCMVEVGRLTTEMASELQRGDHVTVQMLLAMRAEELDKIAECEKNLYLFRESSPDEMKDWLSHALSGKMSAANPYGREGETVLRLAGSIRSVWEKIMDTDLYMSKRLAGKDSFYAAKQ